MTGWLIYDSESAVRNRTCINMYLQQSKMRGMDLKFLLDTQLDFCNPPDFAIVRTMQPNINKKLEALGVRVFNNSFVSEMCNNKQNTYKYVSENGIEILPVFYGQAGIVPDNITFPCVIKPSCSHGGNNVRIINNKSELEQAVNDIYPDSFVCQAVATDKGKDLRVYIIGNKIICAMLRTSEKDFRSNFCLGGKAELYTLTKQETELVKRIISLFDFGLVGIDFVFNNEKIVFNEIEDVVGARMLYEKTQIDIVSLYLDYILKEIK